MTDNKKKPNKEKVRLNDESIAILKRQDRNSTITADYAPIRRPSKKREQDDKSRE